jgi:hypothetical protein
LQRFVGFAGRNLDDAHAYIGALRGHGIEYHLVLASHKGAVIWLKQKRENVPQGHYNMFNNWTIYRQDLDNDITTPDNILIVDGSDNIKFVDGYALNKGAKKRKDQVFYNIHPTQDIAAKFRKELKGNREDEKIYNRYITYLSNNNHRFLPYDEFAVRMVREKPKLDPRYYDFPDHEKSLYLETVHDVNSHLKARGYTAKAMGGLQLHNAIKAKVIKDVYEIRKRKEEFNRDDMLGMYKRHREEILNTIKGRAFKRRQYKYEPEYGMTAAGKRRLEGYAQAEKRLESEPVDLDDEENRDLRIYYELDPANQRINKMPVRLRELLQMIPPANQPKKKKKRKKGQFINLFYDVNNANIDDFYLD